jgi:hypothetical protein
MPRKSAESLKVIDLQGRLPLLRPPPSLSPAERTIFIDIVASNDPKHFRLSDQPLLARYVETCVLSEVAAKELRRGAVVDGKPSPWLIVQEKCVRAMAALSMRLRLSPQARKVNASAPQHNVSVYDRMKHEPDET